MHGQVTIDGPGDVLHTEQATKEEHHVEHK